MSRYSLDHFYHGKIIENGQTRGDFTVTAVSQGLDPEEVNSYYYSAGLGSFNDISKFGKQEQIVGLMQHNEKIFVAVNVRSSPVRDRGYYYPDYHIILLPAPLVRKLQGNLKPLMALFDGQPNHPTFSTQAAHINHIEMPESGPADRSDVVRAIDCMLQRLEGNWDLLGQLLTVLAGKGCLAITSGPPGIEEKVEFIQALINCFPREVRPDITFATDVLESTHCSARIKFIYPDEYAHPAKNDFHWIYGGEIRSERLPLHPYVYWLDSTGSKTAELIESRMNELSAYLRQYLSMVKSSYQAFTIAAHRLMIAEKTRTNNVDPESLIQLIQTDTVMPEEECKFRYRTLIELAVANQKISLLPSLFSRVAPPGWFPAILLDQFDSLIQNGHGDVLYRMVHQLTLNAVPTPFSKVNQKEPSEKESTFTPFLDRKYLPKVLEGHLSYLRSQPGLEPQLESFLTSLIRDILEDPDPKIWGPILKVVKEPGRIGRDVTSALIVVTCVYLTERQLALYPQRLPTQEENLLQGLLLTPQTQLYFRDVSYLSQVIETSPQLVKASASQLITNLCNDILPVRGLQSNLIFLQICRMAVSNPRMLVLFSVPVWSLLWEIAVQSQGYANLVDQFQSDISNADWAALADIRILDELISYRVKRELFDQLAALLNALRQNKENRLESTVEIISQNGANKYEDLYQELYKTHLSENYRLQADQLALEKIMWDQCPQAVIRVAAAYIKSSIMPPTHDKVFQLITFLILKGKNDMASDVTKVSIERFFQQRHTTQECASYFSQHVKSIHSDNRAMAFLKKEFRNQMTKYSMEKLADFYDVFSSKKELEELARILYALIIFRHVVGDDGLEGFLFELQTANVLLYRLQTSFDLEDKKSKFDWETFQSQLEVQGANPTTFLNLSQTCGVLIKRIDDMAQKRTVPGTMDLLTKQEKIDEDIAQGKRETKGGLDALQRLSRLFGNFSRRGV
jgi:hypothetical protein